MTIASTTSKVSYSGAGTTGPFSIPYKFSKNADLVAVKVSAAGVESTLALTTHYTLTGAGDPAGGALTLVSALPVGETLIIKRSPAQVQETDYVENAAFPAESHENALDLLTMIAQDLQEQVDRAVLVPISSSTAPADLLDELSGDVAAASASASSAAAAAATATTQAGIATAAAVDAAESAASIPDMDNVLLKAGNLAGLASATTSRTNLGLGDSAVLDVGVGGVQAYDADTMKSDVVTARTRSHSFTPVTITAAAGGAMAIDCAIHEEVWINLAETTTTFGSPSNMVPGAFIEITMNGTTGKGFALHADYLANGETTWPPAAPADGKELTLCFQINKAGTKAKFIGKRLED